MAVKDESLHHATEGLILPKPRKYYQALIFNSHWQLRSLISSPKPNILYYPSGQDVTFLNTKTREREVLAALKFQPRCLVASEDWVCVGGDEGNFVAISLDEKKALLEQPTGLDIDADTRLPLELDPDTAHRTINSLREAVRRHRPPPATTVKATKVGREIVNCITLWSPSPDVSVKAYTVSVAVVANNDCSVIIQTLAEKPDVLQILNFPACVNRAVISPDGAMLATISDDPFLYLHERRKQHKIQEESWNSGHEHNQGYEWVQLCRIQLEGQHPAAEQDQMKGSFAVCFSKTGRYLAVATQYGSIQVLDVRTITERESLMTVFTSSRPSTDRDCGGAVRAMEFSPAPFDLLAWTESSGRAGVADMRNLCFSRQLLTMDHTDAAVERVQITDKSRRDYWAEPRMRPTSTDPPAYPSSDFDRRQLRHIHRELDNRGQQNSTLADDLDVLQAHQIERRRRDAATAAEDALSDVTNVSRWLRANSGTSGNDRRTPTANLPISLRDLVTSTERGAGFRNFIIERNIDRERRGHLQQIPRRRSSILLAAAESELERETMDANATAEAGSNEARTNSDTTSIMDRLSLPPRQASNLGSAGNPWAEVDAFYRTRYAEDPLPGRTTRLRIELENEDLRRDFAQRLRQPWGPLGSDNPASTNESPRTIVDTMGLAWSTDGRILYVGGGNGIYEYHVNVTGRKMYPDLVLR